MTTAKEIMGFVYELLDAGDAKNEKEILAKSKSAVESLEAERNQERALRLDLIERFRAERDALKAMIEEMEKQEPVAWGLKRADGLILDVICPDEHDANEGGYTIPLYLASGAKERRSKDLCRYPDCKCPTENPCLMGKDQP